MGGMNNLMQRFAQGVRQRSPLVDVIMQAREGKLRENYAKMIANLNSPNYQIPKEQLFGMVAAMSRGPQAKPQVPVGLPANIDKSNLIEYTTRQGFKMKTLKGAIDNVHKKFNGGENPFLGKGRIEFTKEQLKSEYIADKLKTYVKKGTPEELQYISKQFKIDMSDLVKASPQPLAGAVKGQTVYHGTDKAFKDFDISKSADGSIWFTTSKKAIQKGAVAASGKGKIVERIINESKLKLGGWKEADKFGVDELIQQGYDGLKLADKGETTYQIFFPEKLIKP